MFKTPAHGNFHTVFILYLFHNDKETSTYTDVCVRVVFVPGGNPPVPLGDHMTISHTAVSHY